MQTTSQTYVGRPVSVCLDTGAADGVAQYDKWVLLKALTDSAEHFEISHRTLSVLKALMTFLPERDIAAEPGSAIVFPANKTLSDRLNGMPESTLRRHLATLTSLGIVSRHDSPNRKRFARRLSGKVTLAYGFDLSPLALHAEQLFNAAAQAAVTAEKVHILRDRILELRSALLLETPSERLTELLSECQRVLRRKPCVKALEAFCAELELAGQGGAGTSNQNAVNTHQVSASDSQNERHIQVESKYDSDSEQIELDEKNTPTVSLVDLMAHCTEYKSYFPEPVRHWSDVISIANRLAPMLAIDGPVLQQAKKSMGVEGTAATIMYILERFSEIKSPGAYLRRLSVMAEQGSLSFEPMLMSLKRRQMG